MLFAMKIFISALIIAGVSELAKKITPLAAILASLPLTSILAMIWLYKETQDIQKVIDLSKGIFWALLPSLLFFIVLPVLLKAGIKFSLAMVISSIIMAIGYSIYMVLLNKIGIKI